MAELEEKLNGKLDGSTRREFVKGIIETMLGFGTLAGLVSGCAQSSFSRWGYDIEIGDRTNPRIVDLNRGLLVDDILNVCFTTDAAEALRNIPFGVAESLIDNNDYEIGGVAFVNDTDPISVFVREDRNYRMIIITIHEYIHQGTALGFINSEEFNLAYERLRNLNSPIVQLIIESVENRLQSQIYDDVRNDADTMFDEMAAYLGEYMCLLPEIFPEDIWNVYGRLLRNERLDNNDECELSFNEHLTFDVMIYDDTYELNRLYSLLNTLKEQQEAFTELHSSAGGIDLQDTQSILESVHEESELCTALSVQIEHVRENIITQFSEFFLYRLDRLSDYLYYAKRCVE